MAAMKKLVYMGEKPTRELQLIFPIDAKLKSNIFFVKIVTMNIVERKNFSVNRFVVNFDK